MPLAPTTGASVHRLQAYERRKVKEKLRHSSTRVTEKCFIKVAGKLGSNAAERFDAVI